MAKGKKTGGRKKGSVNKITADLKSAILEAAVNAGNGNMTLYLQSQAIANPTAFMGLLGRVLPLTVGSDPDKPFKMTLEWLKPSE